MIIKKVMRMTRTCKRVVLTFEEEDKEEDKDNEEEEEEEEEDCKRVDGCVLTDEEGEQPVIWPPYTLLQP